jgi:hypothetical protein
MPITNYPQVDSVLLSESPVVATGLPSRQGTVTIEILPDDALIEIFSFYLEESYESWKTHEVERIDAWYTLVYVSRRWQNVVFASSHRLNLRLLYTNRRPVPKTLNHPPTLPIVIWQKESNGRSPPQVEAWGTENIISALERRDRVSRIYLTDLPVLPLGRFTETTQESFPALTHLELESKGYGKSALILQDTFLGGSAPRLRSLRLHNVRFLSIHKLLLSTNDLVDLHLLRIPPFGYISPQAMVNCLSSLTRLEDFRLGLQQPASSPPHPTRPAPLTRVDLSSLARLWFSGNSFYLEDLAAWINLPSLYTLEMVFLNHIHFDVFQLTELIDRVDRFKALDQAEVFFYHKLVRITLSSKKGSVDRTMLTVVNECRPSEFRFLFLAQVHNSLLSLLSSLERLDISEDRDCPAHLQDDVDNAHWLKLLQPFTGVKDLHISGLPGLHTARVLKDLTKERVVEFLPALQNVFFEGPSGAMARAIRPFIAKRQLSGHPVSVRGPQSRKRGGR